LVARPFGAWDPAGLDPRGVVAALAAAVFSAGAYVTVRRLSAGEHYLVIVFYFALVSTLCALPLSMTSLRIPSPTGWVLLAGVGISTQFGQIFITKGLEREPAGRATSVSYLQIVFAVAWGVLFFDESPDGWSIAGALTIVTSTLLLGRVAARHARRARPS
jgi:drug/metabolite transporter (DMT)-like permease